MNEVSIEPFHVIGIAIRTTNENNQAASDIPALWARFMGEKISDVIPNKIDNSVYSIYTDYEKDHTRPYTTLLGCKVKNLDSIPDGMIGKSFDGGQYIKLTANGDLSQGIVFNKWLEIWGMNMERIFTADWEVYGEKAQNPSDAEVDIFIAVK